MPTQNRIPSSPALSCEVQRWDDRGEPVRENRQILRRTPNPAQSSSRGKPSAVLSFWALRRFPVFASRRWSSTYVDGQDFHLRSSFVRSRLPNTTFMH